MIIDDILFALFMSWLFGMEFTGLLVLNNYPKEYEKKWMNPFLVLTPVVNICYGMYWMCVLIYNGFKLEYGKKDF